jgi:hypothetical protein
MRTALIAALRRTGTGTLRAGLPLAGRSVLARQVDLLRSLGCERILCLCESPDAEILKVQQAVEASGGTFQALRGFLHLPALVRAEEELVILADGLLPDPAVTARLFAEAAPPRLVACLPSDSPLVAAHPDDFERIDAARHWGGVLVMRGAPVQHLADFPPDADAISLLLRLALQAGTPCRDLPAEVSASGTWLLASEESALAAQEQALISRASGLADWRRPSTALAGWAARALAPRGLARGPAFAALAAVGLHLGALAAPSWGYAAAGLALAAAGAMSAALTQALGAMRRELLGEGAPPAALGRLDIAVDVVAAAVLLLALSPAGTIAPLAALGPVLIGLARLTPPAAPLAVLADRVMLPGGLALAALFGVLPHAAALLALLLLGGLLLRDKSELG